MSASSCTAPLGPSKVPFQRASLQLSSAPVAQRQKPLGLPGERSAEGMPHSKLEKADECPRSVEKKSNPLFNFG